MQRFDKKRQLVPSYSIFQKEKQEEKENTNMTLYEELQARGLIAQVTDEELIADLINNGKATFYIGFDPTAYSCTATNQCDWFVSCHLQTFHQT